MYATIVRFSIIANQLIVSVDNLSPPEMERFLTKTNPLIAEIDPKNETGNHQRNQITNSNPPIYGPGTKISHNSHTNIKIFTTHGAITITLAKSLFILSILAFCRYIHGRKLKPNCQGTIDLSGSGASADAGKDEKC